MRISVVMPNFNGVRFLGEALDSVLAQREGGLDVELVVVDGGSTDGSLEVLRGYGDRVSCLISGPDGGPADAINKGLRRCTGDVLGWLNSDDRYAPRALQRVTRAFEEHPDRAICFGHCPILDVEGREIRRGITRFKEAFFPLSSRFTLQCINYISQPATFFRRTAWEKAGPLRTDLRAAWDYALWLRLWRQGGAMHLRRPELACFRWHEGSISGRHFRRQFAEEWRVAAADAGRVSPQALVHLGVWWGIVLCYSLMQKARVRGGRSDP